MDWLFGLKFMPCHAMRIAPPLLLDDPSLPAMRSLLDEVLAKDDLSVIDIDASCLIGEKEQSQQRGLSVLIPALGETTTVVRTRNCHGRVAATTVWVLKTTL